MDVNSNDIDCVESWVMNSKRDRPKSGRPGFRIRLEAYQKLENRQTQGLILAQGAMADLDDEINEMCDAIYKAREKEESRGGLEVENWIISR